MLVETSSKKTQEKLDTQTTLAERLDHDLRTQKEITLYIEQSKNDHISRLKQELSSLDAKWQLVMERELMRGEEGRSQGVELTYAIEKVKGEVFVRDLHIADLQEQVSKLGGEVAEKNSANERALLES